MEVSVPLTCSTVFELEAFPDCGKYSPADNTYGFFWATDTCPDPEGDYSEDARYTESNMKDYVIKCVKYNVSTGAFDQENIDNTQIVVDWDSKIVTCKTTKLGTFAVTFEKKDQVITPVEPPSDRVDEEDDDEFEAWEEFNAAYFASILLGVTLIYALIGFVLDKIKKAEPPVASLNPAAVATPGPEVTPAPKEAFEQSEFGAPNDEKPPQQVEIIDPPELPVERLGFLSFMLHEHLLLSPIINAKWNYSRPARICTLMLTLLVELFLVGVLDFTDNYAVSALVAVAIGLIITPLLAIAFYVPQHISMIGKLVKIVIGVIVAVAVIGICFVLTILATDDIDDSDDNDFWVYGFAVAIPIELFVAETLKTAVKYTLIHGCTGSIGNTFKDF